jgi:predicted porin
MALMGSARQAVAKLLSLSILAALAAFTPAANAADAPRASQAEAQPPSPCFASLYDFARASAEECPLSWNGLTLYATLDVGASYDTHGVPFNGAYPHGVETLISKNSNRALTSIAPNGLSQSSVGVKGAEPLAPDWSLIFNLETGFDPYSLQFANGPKSLVQNNATTLEYQSGNGDSSRAGQPFNTVAYAGISNRTFGALTVGRQDSLVLDALSRYDAMGAAHAFSVIGDSNTVAGVGDTEDARYNTSVQYKVVIGPIRLAALYQFGGYDQGNGSNGAFEAAVGGDFGGFSFDAVGSKVKDAVSLSNFGEYPLPSGVGIDDLKATLSNNTAGAVMAKYNAKIATVFGGFEYILFQNPSDAFPNGFTTLGGYTVLPGDVNSTAYAINKVLRAFWTGVRFDIRDDLSLAGAYYHYYQNDYSTSACTEGGLSASSCHGTENAVSAMIDYRPIKRVDAYAGVMWSQVTGGLASGYLYHINLVPTAGVRIQF